MKKRGNTTCDRRTAMPESPPRAGAPARDVPNRTPDRPSAADLDAHFQPIVAVRRGAVIGVEALARARDTNGQAIAPLDLFAAAARTGTAAALDRACRRTALERFAPLHRRAPTLVCFVNCHVETFLADVDGPDGWPALAATHGIDPRALALEVLETEAPDLAALAAATARYRAAGFLVVVDDVGVGHSNLDRVAALQPDLLKADRSLVAGCAGDRVRRAVLRALVGLSEEIGGWLVIEGVEREEDALAALDIGADLVQGFHLARPAPLADSAPLDDVERRVQALAGLQRQRTTRRVGDARGMRDARTAFARATAAILATCAPSAWGAALAGALRGAPGGAASAAVLDAAGRQLTATVRPDASAAADRVERTLIFAPPAAGDDHALKEYVYLLDGAPEAVFESPPYVPLPNERLCVTLSTAFVDAEGTRRLLCLHLYADAQGPPDVSPPGIVTGV